MFIIEYAQYRILMDTADGRGEIEILPEKDSGVSVYVRAHVFMKCKSTRGGGAKRISEILKA